MGALSATSESKLATCDHRLQRVVREVVRIWPGELVVLCGHRGQAEQDTAFALGHSKKRWPDGEHNALPSNAVDLAPLEVVNGARKINWNDRERMNLLAGHMLAAGALFGPPIRWGGDWDRDSEVADNGFDDLVHYELVR